jgi:hypothetical protein
MSYNETTNKEKHDMNVETVTTKVKNLRTELRLKHAARKGYRIMHHKDGSHTIAIPVK